MLGLGCGDGSLLHYLKTRKDAVCTGIDIDEGCVARCIERGLTVLQGDINDEVRDYPDDAFDFVILAQTLQQIYDPAPLICTLGCLRSSAERPGTRPHLSSLSLTGLT